MLSWWFLLQIMGAAALPLAWRFLAFLPGRGYAFAKALGLLLTAYGLWLGASFRLVPNDTGGAIVALVAVLGLSCWLGREGLQRDASGARPLVAWLRTNRRLVLATELLFLVVLAAWTAFRAYNPDIAGTEKPMEFAFINGVLRSRFFPPQDPWLSGHGISYYYFGYVMVSLLIRLSGVLPEVGFNLAVAAWYALVAVGAFGLVSDLVGLSSGSAPGRAAEPGGMASPAIEASQAMGVTSQNRNLRWGLLGALLVGLVANLEGAIDSAYHRGLLPGGVVQWLDIKGLAQDAPTGQWTGGFWWWWRASRVLHDKDLLGNSVEVIDEFPFFSFLLGDLHPHVLAFPFAFLAMAMALNLLAGDWVDSGSLESGGRGPFGALRRIWMLMGRSTGVGAPGALLYAVILGALIFLNTWDYPIYLGLTAIVFGIHLARCEGLGAGIVARAALSGVVWGVLGWFAYLPFHIGFQSQLGGLLPNLLFPTRFTHFFLMFGQFLVPVTFFLVLVSRQVGSRATARSVLRWLPWTLAVPLAVLGLILVGLWVLPQGRAVAEEIMRNPAVQANLGGRDFRGLVSLIVQLRAGTPWTYLALAILLAWAGGILSAMLTRRPGLDIEPTAYVLSRPESGVTPGTDYFVLLLIGLAALLALVPEFLYLRDLFNTRMNTVFKFYYQAWAMLAVASAYGLSRLAARRTPPVLKAPALALMAFMLLATLWYPVASIPSKADGFQADPTLDGLAHLRRYNPADMAAIEWLRANVAPDAIVVEASGGSYSTEGAGRVSMATGNPTLLGWDFHERQWRGNDGYERMAAARPDVLDRIYRTASAEELHALLAEWDVDYVYVGALERNAYGIGDAALSRFERVLQLVYDQDAVRIYAR